eukprot:759556-Hanusia_phi.AAC.2
MAEQSSVSLSESFERHPIAPTSLIPLKLSLPGMHEGMFHPLPPPIPVKAASEPTVTFVHMRQYNRIMKRRRSQLNGGFHFHINMKQPKKDSLVKHAKARQRSSAGTFKSIDKDMQTRKPGRRPCSNKPKKPDISCGTCRYCKDRPKFGGSGRLKQKCILLKKNPKATIVRNNFLSEIQACRFNPQLPEQDDEASKVSMESVSSANSEEEEEEEEKEEKEIAASTRVRGGVGLSAQGDDASRRTRVRMFWPSLLSERTLTERTRRQEVVLSAPSSHLLLLPSPPLKWTTHSLTVSALLFLPSDRGCSRLPPDTETIQDITAPYNMAIVISKSLFGNNSAFLLHCTKLLFIYKFLPFKPFASSLHTAFTTSSKH